MPVMLSQLQLIASSLKWYRFNLQVINDNGVYSLYSVAIHITVVDDIVACIVL